MPRSKKSMKNEPCHGCLSVGKRLLPINEYLILYKKLMDDVLDDEMKLETIPCMCRECRNVLKSAQKFQATAKAAFKSLQMAINSDDKMIQDPKPSTLTHSTSKAENKAIKVIFDNNTIVNEGKVNDQSEEVKAEFEYVLEDIKQEKQEKNEYEVKIEMDDTGSINDEADFIDNEETAIKEEVAELEVTNQIKSELNKRRRKRRCMAFRRIDYKSFSTLCVAVPIDDEERQRCVEAEKKNAEYLNSNFKCEMCVVGFNKRQRLDKHLNVYHSESHPYECTVCGVRVSSKLILMRHTKTHGRKYVCSFCGIERLAKRAVFAHLTRVHRVVYECRECGLQFRDKYKEFYKHFTSMHKRFECDYCGFGGSTKNRLINHIKVNHCENICKYCNKKYVNYHSMMRHIALIHTKEVSEESYCVECNMQFDNISLYDRHLKTSVKHKPKVVYPCTECSNVYAKKIARTNHYKYIHLQKTDYYCVKCSRYFLNGFRLRTHIATYHNHIQAPKNKICSYCGRGFVTNRILENHIRTHTGERPFSCSHCTATFAQKSALVTHARAIHKVMMRYATKEKNCNNAGT